MIWRYITWVSWVFLVLIPYDAFPVEDEPYFQHHLCEMP